MPLTMIGQWHYLQKLFQMTVLLFQFNISPESPVAPKQLNYIRSAQGRWQYDAANSRWHQYLIDNNFLVIRINQLQNIVWMIVTDVKRVIVDTYNRNIDGTTIWVISGRSRFNTLSS